MNELLSYPAKVYELVRRMRDGDHDPAYLDQLVAHWKDPDNVPLPTNPDEELKRLCVADGIILLRWVPAVGGGETLELTDRGVAALLMWERSQQIDQQLNAEKPAVTPAPAKLPTGEETMPWGDERRWARPPRGHTATILRVMLPRPDGMSVDDLMDEVWGERDCRQPWEGPPMSLKSEIARLNRVLASLPAKGDAAGGKPFRRFWLWCAGLLKPADLTTDERADWAAHQAARREQAMAHPVMDILRGQCARLSLPPPTDPYDPDPIEEVIRLAALPTPH